jgi:hypothetical protein
MTTERFVQPWRVVTALLALCLLPSSLQAQPDTDVAPLRAEIEAAYTVTPVRGGIGLLPREVDRGFALIELRGGTVVVDGDPVSGQELAARLGVDADLILRLTYLDPDLQQAAVGLSDIPAPAVGDAPVSPTAEPENPDRRVVRRDIVRVGGRVHVTADERVRGDVVVIGGSLAVDGEVSGDITVIGGSAEFGPQAVARRDVTIVGGRLTRDPGARFSRGVNEISLDMIDLDFGGLPSIRLPRPSLPRFRSFELVGTLIRFAFFGLLGSVVLLVAAGSADRVARRVLREPVKAGFVGFLAQLLFVPILVLGILLLVVTIIGIPLLALLPVVLVGAVMVMVVGFTGVAQGVGRLLLPAAGKTRSALVVFWLGLAIVMTPTLFGEALGFAGTPLAFFAVLLGVIGLVAEYVAWTTGMGAVILNQFGGASGSASPPPPPPSAAPLGHEPSSGSTPTLPPDLPSPEPFSGSTEGPG